MTSDLCRYWVFFPIHGWVVAQFAVSDFQHRQLQNTLSRMRGFPRIRRSRRNRNTPLFLSSPPQSALKLRNIRNLKNFESSRCGPPPSLLLWSGSTPLEPSRFFDFCEILEIKEFWKLCVRILECFFWLFSRKFAF